VSTPSAAAFRALLALSFVVVPLAARAQTVSAACKPVLDASTKEISTPHHVYQSESIPGKDAPEKTSEVIATATTSFVLYNGKWTQVRMTPQENLAQMKENLRNSKIYECEKQPDAILSGVPMFVYLAHSKNDMADSRARLWVIKSTGLIHSEDIDLDTGVPAGKRHLSIRYDYTNVQPPPGAK
jgi:hypothetical protein